MVVTEPTAPAVADGVTTPVVVEASSAVPEPTYYRVMVLNDDSTLPEFVERALREIFAFTANDANSTMRRAHEEGSAPVMSGSQDLCESKCGYANLWVATNGAGGNGRRPGKACELRFIVEELM